MLVQFMLGKFWLGQVSSVSLRLEHVQTGLVSLVQFTSGKDMIGHVMSG
jgi:hypothetical protein